MRKPSRPKPKYWMPVTAGARQGRYEVSEGMITVEFNGRSKTTQKSGSGDDQGLAALILSELTGWE